LLARILLDTYVGRRTGGRVLSGAITRGSGEAIRAVIWICDLRGFTRLTDAAPRSDVIALLNDYFKTVAEAVFTEGGEVLKSSATRCSLSSRSTGIALPLRPVVPRSKRRERRSRQRRCATENAPSAASGR
jgi:hypothetical protein